MPGDGPRTVPGTVNSRNSLPIGSSYISGKVILSGGFPVTEPITVQRVCGTAVEPIGYTDSKGRFNIDLGSTGTAPFDAASRGTRTGATAGTRVSPAAWRNCEIRASLAGFRSDVVPLAGRQAFDHPDIGVIVLHRIANVEGTTVSATSALAPPDARKAFTRGMARAAQKKLDETEKLFEKAVAIYPKYAMVWYEIGRLRAYRHNLDGAIDALNHAMAADPKFIKPYIERAKIQSSRQEWTDVVRLTDDALKLNAEDVPDAWLLNAMGNVALHRIDAAELGAAELLRLEMSKSNPKADHIVALVHAQRGRWAQAAEWLRRYVERIGPGPDRDLALGQLAQAERLAAAAWTAAGQPQ